MPERTVIGYQEVSGIRWELLDCGHLGSEAGFSRTLGERRRCRKCEARTAPKEEACVL